MSHPWGANADHGGAGRKDPRPSSAPPAAPHDLREGGPGESTRVGGMVDGSSATHSLPASLSDDAAELFKILSMASADRPVTQERAGKLMGFAGGRDNIRRRIQHLRDEINASNDRLVVSSWGKPAGMWIAATEQEEDEYIGRVLKRAFSTVEQFKGLDKARRQRILTEFQGHLSLDDSGESEIGPQKCVHASTETTCAECGSVFEPSRPWQRFCSYGCQQSWNGRKAS